MYSGCVDARPYLACLVGSAVRPCATMAIVLGCCGHRSRRSLAIETIASASLVPRWSMRKCMSTWRLACYSMICDACWAQPRNTHNVWMTYSSANPLSLPVFNFGAFPADMEEDASVNKMRWKPKATPSGAQFSPLSPFCVGFTNLHTAFTFCLFVIMNLTRVATCSRDCSHCV